MSTDEANVTSLLQLLGSVLQERVSVYPVEGGPAISDAHTSKEDAMRLAVQSALYEVAWTSGASRFDEEHQTASFMGHLASNLTWYAIAWAYSQDEETGLCLPEVFWSGHTKHPGTNKDSPQYQSSETQTGMDFGVIALDPEGREYRIALFQAKMAKAKDAAHIKQGEFDADLEFSIHYSKTGYRQIEAMEKTQKKGNEKAHVKTSWCHFAVWHSEYLRYPQRVSLDQVLSKVGQVEPKLKKAELNHTDEALSEVVFDTITGGGSGESYLTIDAGLVSDFINQIVELMPRIQIFAVDEGGRGEMGETLSKTNMKLYSQSAHTLKGGVVRRDRDFIPTTPGI